MSQWKPPTVWEWIQFLPTLFLVGWATYNLVMLWERQ